MTPTPARIRIVVADDHPALRAGVRRFLEADPALEVIAEAASGEEALALARRLGPDVLLLDVELPDISGVEVARRLRAEGSAVRVLALTAYDHPAFVRGLIDAGAAGYVTKDKDPAVIIESVKGVARGEGRWFVRMAAPDPALAALSVREREVLTLLAGGRSNEAIADALCLSVHTVRNHLASLYSKLDVTTAREAVAWAWQHGVISGPDEARRP